MDRRKAMKTATGIFALGGVGALTLANAFKPEIEFNNEASKLDYTETEPSWTYLKLDPEVSAKLAYDYYPEGSCMYATAKSVLSQLSELIGEPYTSFPTQMFKYGHGGIGGYGTTCGTLNGAAAVLGLLITDKSIRDTIIADLFHWYEQESLPQYIPQNTESEYTPEQSVAGSVLCHASNTNWCATSGYAVSSSERKERCRRLSSDVAKKITMILNDVLANNYMTNTNADETVNTCISCHGSEGKVTNVSAKMSCEPCHTESVAHQVFADIHYKLME